VTGRRRLTTIVILAVACAATGCAPSPAPSPSPSSSGFTSDAEAFAAAEATYRAYVDALNQVDLADPTTFEPVFAWSGGSLEEADRQSFETARENGLIIGGDFRVVTTSGVDWDRYTGSVRLHACLDVSATEITGAAGNRQQGEDREPRVALILTLSPGDTATRLRLTDTQPREDQTLC